MDNNTPTHPRATIVMTARERHSLTEAAIESVVADTPRPYRFIYVDVQSPEWLRESLAEHAEEWGLEVIRFDEPLWPQAVRQRIAGAIATEYTVFIDNDVQVDAGWLDALIACADATGAGLVGPLTLWGDGLEPPRIHMAGGMLLESAAAGGRVLDEAHHLMDADPRQVAAQLTRGPCGFVEFHCMLVRTSLARESGLFDPDVRCVHEHIDVSLKAAERGLPVYFEPAARVHYMAFSDYMLDDLAFFRERWSVAEAESSIAAFSTRWKVINDDRSFGNVRRFVRNHVAHTDPLRETNVNTGDRQRAMGAEELVQSRSALLDLAARRRYGNDELALLASAYSLAQVRMDGGYRPCGRPFINHVVGTAGVLVRYDFSMPVVAAALLHAAYSHVDPSLTRGTLSAIEAVRTDLMSLGVSVERKVRAYTERAALDGELLDPEAFATLSIPEAEVIAIEAANEIEMLFSGEIRYSGRTDEITAEAVARVHHVCRILGAEGLAATLDAARAMPRQVAPELQTALGASYRIAPDRRSMIPMYSAQLQESTGNNGYTSHRCRSSRVARPMPVAGRF